MGMRSRSRRAPALMAGGLALMSLVALVALPAAAAETGGAVFTMSNAAAGNEVVVYARAADGSLTHVADYGTEGAGSGGGLGSQGSVRLSDNGDWLLVVNAGSDEVSVFEVDGTTLELTDTVWSGGDSPISVDVSGNVVYVLNAGSANIAGFRLRNDGTLSPIEGAVRALSASDAAPAQIEFSPDGRTLVVTEKNTNLILAYRVSASGMVSQAHVSGSAGMTPFGFEFDPAGHLIVSEAFGGAPDASTVSSYHLGPNRKAEVIEGPVATTETAACWLVVTDDGQYAYVANAGSASITGYRLEADGSLTILDDDGVTAVTGAGAIDLALSRQSEFLYSVGGGSDTISVFRVEADGSLSLVQTVTGLPSSSVGLASF